jgi:hypothetical protein
MPQALILRMGAQKPSFCPEEALQPFNGAKNPVSLVFLRNMMCDRLTIISRSGRVFEMVNYWQVLLVNPPLQKSRLLDRT